MRMSLALLTVLVAAPAWAGAPTLGTSLSNCGPSKPVEVKIPACSAVVDAPPNKRSLERALNTRGLAYLQSSETGRAISDFSRVITLDPSVAGYFDNRQNAYRAAGNLAAALADANQAIRLAPTYSFVWRARGSLLALMGSLPSALADYNKTLQLSPQDAGALFERGKVWVQLGDSVKAIADFGAAIQIDPQYAEAYRERALTFKSTGRNDLAADDFRAALRIRPGDQVASDGLHSMEASNALPSELPKPLSAALGRRVALVIGNSNYQAVPVLPNPRMDAEHVASALRTAGFDTVVKNDLTRDQFASALADFASTSADADWALIYYAGHGIEISGANYLIPVDAKLATDRAVEFEAVPLTQAMDAVEGAHKLRLVILDACRANPFAAQMRSSRATRDITRGLARPPEASPGLLVVYAARDGELASDGDGTSGSPFASAFVREVQKPGTEVRRLFDLVSDDVIETTSDKQHPLTYGRVPGREDFYFRAASAHEDDPR